MEAQSRGDGRRVCRALGASGRRSWANEEEDVATASERAEIGWKDKELPGNKHSES